MGENFDANVIFEKAPLADSRLRFIEHVFEWAPEWLGRPQSIAINNTVSGDFQEVPWPSGRDLIPEVIEPGVLVHIYGTKHSGGQASLSLDEVLPRAVHTVAIPISLLAPTAFDEVTEKLIQLFKVATTMSRVLVVAGPEVTVDAGESTLERIARDEMREAGNSSLVIGLEQFFTYLDSRWRLEKRWESYVALRRSE